MNQERPDINLAAVAKSFSVKPGTPLSPYICSTVYDFQSELRILHDKVFPQLAELCIFRKTHFSPTDFGWNRSSLNGQENSYEGLRLSLDYVTKCSPFFLCLLGQRYGLFRDQTEPQLSYSSVLLEAEEEEENKQFWIEKNLLFAASSGYRWLLDDVNQYCSITELTIKHAVLNSYSSSSSSAAQHFSFFYFRQPDHLELLESDLQHLSPDERSRELALYKSESEFATLCVEELKLNIIKKGLFVRYFCTAEELATFVLDDWKSVIDFLYPPLDSKAMGFEWLSEETELNIFSATCRQLFVHTNKLDSILNKLTAFALDRIVNFKSSRITPARKSLTRKMDSYQSANGKIHNGDQDSDESILLLVGSRGCGKSTLLANWVESFRRASPPVKIFEHYVGCTENSTVAMAMMRRCIAHLRSRKHYVPATDYGLSIEDPLDFDRILQEFNAVISCEGCVLVLDNIDGLFRGGETSDRTVKRLKWLPFPLPPSVTVIASCTNTDLAYRSLADRPDVKVLSFPSVEDVISRRAMIINNAALNGRIVDRGDPQLVISGCLANRPLYMALLGGEMRVFVDSARTTDCLRCCAEALSFCDLWRHIIQRWVDEYSWNLDGQNSTAEYSGWVPDFLRLILTSRNGLSQLELLAILAELGFTGPRAISSFDLLRFRLAASSVLVETSAGLIRFMHNHVREATDFVLFGCITALGGYRKVEKTPFEDVGSETPERPLPSKLVYHRHIANYFVKQPYGLRQADELPWQFNKLQDYEMLAQVISDHRLFMDMYGKGSKSHRAHEIVGYWKTLSKLGFSPGAIYLDTLNGIYFEYAAVKHTIPQNPEMKLSCFTQRYCKLSICIGQLLMHLGCQMEAKEVLMHGIFHLNKIMPLSKGQLILLSQTQALIGSVFASCEGRQLEAVKWYEQADETIESLLNNILLDKQRRTLTETRGCLLVYMGNAKTEEGSFAEAEALLNSARDCMLEAKNVVGKALVLYNIGLLQMHQEKFSRSEASLWSALEVLERYHGKSHPTVARIYTELGTLSALPQNSDGFNIGSAEEFYRTAVELHEDCFGPGHVLVANDLFSLGNLLWCSGKTSQKEEAREMIKRAFDICVLKLGDDHSLTKKVCQVLTSQEIQITLKFQAGFEKTTVPQRQSFLPTPGCRAHFKQKMLHCKTPAKPTQLPAISSFSDDAQQPSNLEIHEDFDTETATSRPKFIGFGAQRPGSRQFRDNDSVSVEMSQGSIDQTRHTSEKLKRQSVHAHLGSAQTSHEYHAIITGLKSPADSAEFEETQTLTDSTKRPCTSIGIRRHRPCFEYNENFPRSITSGPYATICSLLNKKQFSLPTPGSLH